MSGPLDLDEERDARAPPASLIVTVEDHNVRTGLGASVAEWLALAAMAMPFERIGIGGVSAERSIGDLAARTGLDAAGNSRDAARDSRR